MLWGGIGCAIEACALYRRLSYACTTTIKVRDDTDDGSIPTCLRLHPYSIPDRAHGLAAAASYTHRSIDRCALYSRCGGGLGLWSVGVEGECLGGEDVEGR